MIINLYDVVNSYRVDSSLVVENATRDIQLSPFPSFVESNKKCHQFDDIYVFGDSLSDIGNAFDATKKANGEGLPPAPPYFRERFSNGQVWVEYLAQLLGLPSKRQTNFAVGGANTDSKNTFDPNHPSALPGLQQELNSYLASLKANKVADPQALYIIWAGANDYLGGGVIDPTVPVANLTKAVTSLARIGAKNIIVVNLPDLGKIPATRTDIQHSTALTALTQAHNSGLAASLQALSQSLGKSTNIIIFDVHSLFNQVLTDPKKFGFTNVTDAELEQLAKFKGYNEKFFFWDIIHLTTAGHMILARSVLTVLQPTTVSA